MKQVRKKTQSLGGGKDGHGVPLAYHPGQAANHDDQGAGTKNLSLQALPHPDPLTSCIAHHAKNWAVV